MVPHASEGWMPSNLPKLTVRGVILWFSFSVKIGTSMTAGC